MGWNPGMQMPPHGLEELPRPVVTFLLSQCRRNPRDALIECLRELAEDGVVRYETDAAGLPAFSLLAQAPRSGRPLLPFEEVALARVRKRAGRLGRVPFSALITDEGDDYESWAKQQQEELGQAARQGRGGAERRTGAKRQERQGNQGVDVGTDPAKDGDVLSDDPKDHRADDKVTADDELSECFDDIASIGLQQD